ncbi:MAG: Calcineurin-like phosphoesterase [Rhizobium sp.]|nr:Calcineurin-like phosphoesterase [Rhizobium sp.]
MLLWIVSDIHLESTVGWELPSGNARPAFDVLVVAGDLIPRMERGVRFLAERVPDRPVIYIGGNHEGYGVDLDRTYQKAKDAALGTSVRVLQNETTTVGDVTFAGATLWTDYDLRGDRPRAMDVAAGRMNDHRKIRTNAYRERFLPRHALERHKESRRFFEEALRRPRPGPLVAVSHHCVLPGSSTVTAGAGRPSDEGMLDAAYRSDLTPLMSPAPDDGRGALRPADLWVFGHTHESFDRVVGHTRVVSNAKGYGPWKRGETWENPRFDPALTIEI